jgi:hypothetical protein
VKVRRREGHCYLLGSGLNYDRKKFCSTGFC